MTELSSPFHEDSLIILSHLFIHLSGRAGMVCTEVRGQVEVVGFLL